VGQHGDELILLPVLLLERAFGIFQLFSLIQFAQRRQLREQRLAHVAAARLGVFQEETRQLRVVTQQKPHILFRLDLRA